MVQRNYIQGCFKQFFFQKFSLRQDTNDIEYRNTLFFKQIAQEKIEIHFEQLYLLFGEIWEDLIPSQSFF